MTDKYFYNKWGYYPNDIYDVLMDMDTFKDTIEKVGVDKSFSLIEDLTKYFVSTEQYENCKHLVSLKLAMDNGLEMV